MLEKFTNHPKEQDETYLQHMRAAWKIVYVLKTLELKCIIHSIFPFLYTNVVSAKIEDLQKLTNRKGPDDEELYEIFGGD
jgi:hypothetical protein